MVALAQRLVLHRAFQGAVIAIILLAGVLAGLETSPALVARHGALLHGLDRVVLAVFVVELALKLLAAGRAPWRYFADGWNCFDSLIIALCFLPVAGPFASVLRLARVFRLLRLVHALPKLQLLVGALLKSLSAMGYVSLLLALMFYIYGVAGVHLFGASDADFGSLPAALLTLFRVVTLDNWGDFFARALDHAHPLVVSLYFVTFIVLGTMIILNLFIGIVMNSMAEMHKELEADAAPAAPALAAELAALETQLAATQRRLQAMRATLATPAGQSAAPPPASPPT
jgi:voltage-gated sodium channel